MRWFLRRLFPPHLPKPKQKYVGFVHGISHVTDEDGVERYRHDGYWILTELAGQRSASKIGTAGNSPYALHRFAMVEVWLAGGPVPSLGYSDGPTSPKPKPRKPLPTPKVEGNVVHLPRKSA